MANTKELHKWNQAIWQYLVDHSSVSKTGKYYIKFFIENDKQFFQRVKARYRSEFKRKDLDEEKNKHKSQEKIVTELQKMKVGIDRYYSAVNKIEQGKNVYKKALLKVHKWTRKKIISH